ncbi:GGDEF domain-containing protein [Marinitoga sp. 38H-ov]|uniref:GGDEF domain-containing protein n=1 Tax=Marinitoga sp. 38H-ov TaxID=1755814 RepID=UPI0013EA6FC2|nr:GGDEF domain-containing protein [Marinitoga sp. 38H-ov]KAF2956942.1 hypothetical protein AS160_02850 [Marinitoga sp. 38H-ov]
MTRIFMLIFTLIVTLSFSVTLRVGIYEYPPIIINEKNEIKGVLPEILNFIAKKEDIHLEYKYTTFEKCFELLKNEDIDIMLGVGYTKERDEKFEYNKIPFINSRGGVFVLEDSKIFSFLDINNKKVGVLKKDIYYEGPNGLKNIAKTMGLNIEFVEYDNYSDIFKAILTKEISAGVFDYYIGNYFYEKKGIKETPLEFYIIDLYIIYHNKNLKNIIEKIDKNLRELKNNENSVYYLITKKYLKENSNDWIYAFLIISTIVFLFLIIIVIIMKKIINQKTKELQLKNIELKRLASLDSLTKVYNRRMGFELLNHLIFLSQRKNKPLIIGFIDIDNLKYINDNFGHSIGDKIIITVSKIIKKNIRKSDILARYGGDEFFVGLYDCNIESAKRIEKNIKFELANISKSENLPINVSIGFIEYNENETIDSLISKADKIMYQNKRKNKH